MVLGNQLKSDGFGGICACVFCVVCRKRVEDGKKMERTVGASGSIYVNSESSDAPDVTTKSPWDAELIRNTTVQWILDFISLLKIGL